MRKSDSPEVLAERVRQAEATVDAYRAAAAVLVEAWRDWLGGPDELPSVAMQQAMADVLEVEGFRL